MSRRRTAARRPAQALVAACLLLAAAACGGAHDDPGGSPAARKGEVDADRARLRLFWETYRAATAARTGGDAATAIGLYRQILEDDPVHADSLHYLASLLYARGDLAAAHELLVRLTEAESHSLRGWQRLSVLQGTPAPGWAPIPDVAVASVRKAIEWHPGNSGAHVLHARWTAWAGDEAAAREALAAALELNPEDAEARELQSWLRGDTRSRHGTAAPTAGRLRTASSAPPPEARLVAAVDLDGDGRTDLRASAFAAGEAARLQIDAGDGRSELPGHRQAPGWVAAETTDVRATVWRGAFLAGPDGLRLVLVGGGEAPVRLFAADDTSALWRRIPAPGLPARLYGAVLAAGDLDGDGLTDLVLGNAPPDQRSAGDSDSGDTVDAWLALPDGDFARHALGISSPAAAALVADLDSDGLTDLLVATLAVRDNPGAPGEDAAATEGGVDAVLVVRGTPAGLRPAPGLAPAQQDPVSDLGLLRSGDGVEVLLATGGLSPGSMAADRLWRWHQERLIDVSEDLGDTRFGSTLRALPRGDGALRLLRGGLVPGDPRRELVLRPR